MNLNRPRGVHTSPIAGIHDGFLAPKQAVKAQFSFSCSGQFSAMNPGHYWYRRFVDSPHINIDSLPPCFGLTPAADQEQDLRRRGRLPKKA